MRRRKFVALVGAAHLATPMVRAQRAMPVVGFMNPVSPDTYSFNAVAFREGLAEAGFVEGRNVRIEYRWAKGDYALLPSLAAELAGLKVAAIAATGDIASARAAKAATSTIPIVAQAMGDPVQDGLVASLASPGGNVTGNTFLGPELVAKRWHLLKEAFPAVSRVAALMHPGAYGERTMNDMMKEAEATGLTLGLRVRFVAVQGPDELDRAFSTIAAEHTDAIMMFPSPMLFAERGRIVDLARKLRVPLISMNKQFVKLGGLLSYGADTIFLNRRGAAYVDRILKGASPADLPVQQPTKYELVINLKTAKALGIDIPATLLAHADEVIE